MEYYKLSKDEGFLVSQKAIVKINDKILLLRYPEGGNAWSNKWGLPGGLVEFSEPLEAGLKREIMEETGLKVKIGEAFGTADMAYDGFVFEDGRRIKARIVQIGYICEAKTGEVKVSYEHSGYMWMEPEKIGELELTPDSRQLVEKYMRKNGMPGKR